MLAATDLCFLICEMNIEIRSVRVFAEHGKALVADLKRLLGHVALHGVGGAGIAEDLPAVAAMVLKRRTEDNRSSLCTGSLTDYNKGPPSLFQAVFDLRENPIFGYGNV